MFKNKNPIKITTVFFIGFLNCLDSHSQLSSNDQGATIISKNYYNEGLAYYRGEGVEQDHTKAFQLFQKGADQGQAEAQCSLGVMYYQGQGVVRSYKKAFEWFEKAADQGYARAQYNLGLMYDKGLGVLHDYNEAERWFQKAADQGFEPAQNVLKKEENAFKKEPEPAYKKRNIITLMQSFYQLIRDILYPNKTSGESPIM